MEKGSHGTKMKRQLRKTVKNFTIHANKKWSLKNQQICSLKNEAREKHYNKMNGRCSCNSCANIGAHKMLNEIYQEPERLRSLGSVVKTKLKVIKGTINYTDERPHVSFAHGRILIPSDPKFNIKGIAGDHGCGATIYRTNLNVETFKRRASKIPTGPNFWNKSLITKEMVEEANKIKFPKKFKQYLNQEVGKPEEIIGSLGSGNHFIHMVTDKEKNKYLVIHTGSRGAYVKTVDRLITSYGSKLTDNWKRSLKSCEKLAQLNRDTIAWFMETGDLSLDRRLQKRQNLLFDETHTKLDESWTEPVIQKNITRTRPEGNLVLGSPTSGVHIYKELKDPYVIHGTGPQYGQKGKFVHAHLGEDLTSLANFNRHTKGGGYQLD
jgi:hypothetical protein